MHTKFMKSAIKVAGVSVLRLGLLGSSNLLMDNYSSKPINVVVGFGNEF